MPKLLLKRNGQTQEIPLLKDNFSIGRTPENDLQVDDSLVSRRHSSIIKRGEKYVVYDLGSSNGTYVNKDKIDTRPLAGGDVIRIGDAEMTFLEDGALAPVRNETTGRRETMKRGAPHPLGSDVIIQHVDEIAESYNFDLTTALTKGITLAEIERQIGGEKGAKMAKMFAILYQVGRAVSSASTLDEMLDTATRAIFEVINAERGVILLRTPGKQELVPRLTFDRARGLVDGKDIHVSGTITSQVIHQKVGIITPDALQDPSFMQGLSIVQFNIRSALCVPLWYEKQVYGAVYLDNLMKTHAFTKDDLELLTAIANLIAIRIRQEETASRLRREETLRTNLSKYHSPDVVNMLMARGGEVGLEVADREVSVVFIDVESSSKMAETKGAAQVAGLLNEFFLMATGAVFSQNGHVNKFIGDSVMALFNAPLDMPDHAGAAVRTCVAMLRDLERFNAANPDRRFNVRCGVNTGHVVAGNVGTPSHMEYTVIGDAVNVAARLSKFPRVNTVVVGERTYDLIREKFKARDLGEMNLKGKEKPLRAYEITP